MSNAEPKVRSTPRLLWNARSRYARVLGTVREIQQALWRHRELLRESEEDRRLPMHRDIAASLAELFRNNGGAWIKFAQFLSCRPDLLPPPYIEAFTALRDQAPPARFDDVQPWLTELLGRDWADHFSAFNIIPVACASIAQVHRGCLRDRGEVAVKLQLPQVRAEFSQDAAALRALARLLAPMLREVDLRQVVEQLIRTTEDELDFSLEADNMERFAALPHMPGIHVPKVYRELSAGRILVTEWIEGISLSRLLEDDPDRARPLLERLMSSYLQQVLEFGFFHADPHPGNFIVMPDDSLAVLDFGAIQQISDAQRRDYTALLLRLLGRGDAPLQPLFEAAGFGGLDEQRLERLSAMLIRARETEETLADNLNRMMQEFRQLRLMIPDPFVSVVRVLITMGGLLNRHGITFQWAALGDG